uniref:Uncharacterized protein n=1 Tax=Myotis myotis TaxID=51298 RepID=A0A7J7TTQ6_MYOMY|nr:hypothetical protein mMyoMyo1_008968 [Myotis myotis]
MDLPLRSRLPQSGHHDGLFLLLQSCWCGMDSSCYVAFEFGASLCELLGTLMGQHRLHPLIPGYHMSPSSREAVRTLVLSQHSAGATELSTQAPELTGTRSLFPVAHHRFNFFHFVLMELVSSSRAWIFFFFPGTDINCS